MIRLKKIILIVLIHIFISNQIKADTKEAIKEEIEAVASESRSLANELAEMLSVLEVEDLRNEAVESAVIGDDEKVQNVLKAMVERINKLESKTDEVSDVELKDGFKELPTTSAFSDKEQRLKNSLDNLEVVANEIKHLALTAKSKDEISSVNKMAKILETMTAKLSLDEVKISVDLVLGRDDKINTVENDIEGMIDSLVEVVGAITSDTKGNKNSDFTSDINIIEKEIERNPKQLEDEINIDDVELLENNPGEVLTDTNPVTREPIIIRRKLERQLDDGLSNNEIEGSGGGSTRSGGGEVGVDDEEDCRTTSVTSRVNICVPDFKSLVKPGKIVGQQSQQLRHCYEVSKTVCEDVTNIVSREVCVYPYVQKSVMVVAHMTEIGFETRFRGMEVSRCHTYIENGVHEHKEVEKCKSDFVEKEYWVPTIHEGFEDLIELDIPDAQKHCSIFRFDVPDTICRDITTTECSDVTYLENTVIPTELLITTPDHKPYCEPRVLTQSRQVCTVDNQELKTSEKLRTNINPSFAHKFFTQISDDDDYPIEFEEGLKLEDLFDEVQ